MSNKNSTSPRSLSLKKLYNIKPISPITIVNRNYLIKSNEISYTDLNNLSTGNLSTVDWTLVMSPNSRKRQHTFSSNISLKNQTK